MRGGLVLGTPEVAGHLPIPQRKSLFFGLPFLCRLKEALHPKAGFHLSTDLASALLQALQSFLDILVTVPVVIRYLIRKQLKGGRLI